MVTVEIKNQQKKIPLNPTKIKAITKKILKYEGITRADVSIAFVTDRKIKALNKAYLKRSYTTDVLAFDLSESKKNRDLEGEIVISAITAYNNAKKFHTSPYYELILYVVHGVLHLSGYDDHGFQDKKNMQAKEEKIMTAIGMKE